MLFRWERVLLRADAPPQQSYSASHRATRAGLTKHSPDRNDQTGTQTCLQKRMQEIILKNLMKRL